MSSDKSIPENDWIWHGTAGHFIASASCCFHLHTTIGEYRVSSVGCYHPAGSDGTTPHEIGSGRLYETMVFKNGPAGEPEEWCELDSQGYMTEEEAENGHYSMCARWAARAALTPESL